MSFYLHANVPVCSITAVLHGASETMSQSNTVPDAVSVIATIRVKPGKVDQFIAAFKANIPHVLAEDGCIEYFPAIDIATDIAVQNTDDHVITIIEKWRSLEDLNSHLKAPHMLIYREQVSDLVDDTSLKVLKPA